jgi:hypothetical protein
MKTNKLMYGLLAMGPLGLLFYFLTEFAALDMLDIRFTGYMSTIFQLVMIFAIGMILLTMVASVPVYIQHIRKNPAVPQDERLPWILGTAFAVTVSTNLYFMRYILPFSDAADGKSAVGPMPSRWVLWVFGPNLAYVLGILLVFILHSTPLNGDIVVFVTGIIFAAGMVVAMVRLVKLTIHVHANPRLDASTRKYWLIGLWLLNGPVSILYYLLQGRK